MKVSNITFLLFIVFSFSHCTNKSSNVQEAPAHWKNIPEELMKGLDAHGGLEMWQRKKTMEFSIPKGEEQELHQIDLPSRKVRISHPDYTIGFDGEEVWITPDREAFGQSSPRFYHNLIFYFFACPFVLADPGINYEVLPQRQLNGKTLDAVKVSYNDGVGDAPDDYYIAHFDAETHEMYLLLYTVTYFNQSANENFNALIYDDWTEVGGLKVPQSMKGYKFAADTLGEQRYVRPIDRIEISERSLDPSLFEMPEGAVIDTLITEK